MDVAALVFVFDYYFVDNKLDCLNEPKGNISLRVFFPEVNLFVVSIKGKKPRT